MSKHANAYEENENVYKLLFSATSFHYYTVSFDCILSLTCRRREEGLHKLLQLVWEKQEKSENIIENLLLSLSAFHHLG